MTYHVPVLLEESIEGMNIKPEGVYVDVTFGGGGHSKKIMEKLGDKGRLIAFDQDVDAEQNILKDERFLFVNSNFSYLKRFLRVHGYSKVDGILADLGVSSFQFDTAERGFSYRFDALLDMRMDKKADLTAALVVSKYSALELQNVFSKYGEVRNSKSLALEIVKQRKVKKIETINDFLNAIELMVRGNRVKYLSQVFQALRIEVNREMQVLEGFLNQALEVLNDSGRLVVISYHSLEDRMVKHFFKTGNIEGRLEEDDFGNKKRPFKVITKKPIVADLEENRLNKRARSAKMRIAEKLA